MQIKPPVIFALCCKNIIGRQECVVLERNELLSKSCPVCAKVRGYAQTVRLHGIDDLLNGFSPMFTDTAEDDALVLPTR